MKQPLASVTQIHAAVVFRGPSPKEVPEGNVRALAIRDLVATKPLNWHELPRLTVEEKYLAHCLQPGDVVIPARGDYYKAWLFEGADEPVFPIGQVNVIRPTHGLDARYLVWSLNQGATQNRISSMLTGTSIKALTKIALLSLELEVPPLTKQLQIAELDRTTQQIVALRHRLNDLDLAEIGCVTKLVLQEGVSHA